MRADGDVSRAGSFDRVAHCISVAGMETARDVGGGHQVEQVIIVTGAFAEIGIQVDNHI
jgi:hypothetical protein